MKVLRYYLSKSETTRRGEKQEKLKKKRAAKMEKYKNAKDSNGWDKSFNVIRAITN